MTQEKGWGPPHSRVHENQDGPRRGIAGTEVVVGRTLSIM
jgi:hypothetical protein